MQVPGFVGPAYVSQNLMVANERLVNLYPERNEAPAKSPWTYLPCPGLANYITGLQGPIRALFYQDGRCFAVGGARFYEIFATQTATDYGAVAFAGTPASISSNGTAGHQIFIVSGGFGYIFDLVTNTLTMIGGGFPSPVSMGAFVDTYFLALVSNSAQFNISDFNDGLTWSSLDFGVRSEGSDNFLAMAVDHRQVWLLGSKTTEVWQNTGEGDFPYAPIPGVFIQQGIAAMYSLASFDNTLAWLGANEKGALMVWRADGFTPQRISTHAIELAIQGYSTASDAIAWTYQEQGHEFYVLTFPTAQKTWCYDAATQLWHERSYEDPALGPQAVRGICHTYAFGEHLVGDRLNGTIYRQSVDLYADANDEAMIRLRTAPVLADENKRNFYHRFELDLQPGIGLASGQGSNPLVALRASDDGGRTFGVQRFATAGAQGAYSTRVFWERLGSGRNRVFEVSMSDPVPWRISDAYIDVTGGRF